MKKTVRIVVALLLAAAIPGGCAAQQSGREDELLRELAKLEQQVEDLQRAVSSAQTAQPETQAPAATDPATSATAAPTEPPTTAPAEPQTTAPETQAPAESAAPQIPDDIQQNLDALTAKVEDFIRRANGASAEGGLEAFFAFKQENNQIERELELCEDDLELRYRNGTLSRDEYRRLEWALDDLDDRLDSAEDRLEWTFGIDD